MNSYNLVFGKNAGVSLTTGHHNILIGEDAGRDLTAESFIFDIAGIRHIMKGEDEFEATLTRVENMMNMFFSINKVSFNHLRKYYGVSGMDGVALGCSILGQSSNIFIGAYGSDSAGPRKECDCIGKCNENTCIGRRAFNEQQ